MQADTDDDGMGPVEVDSEDEFLGKRSISEYPVTIHDTDEFVLPADADNLVLLSDEEEYIGLGYQEMLQGNDDLATIPWDPVSVWDSYLNNETPEILPELKATNWLNGQQPDEVLENEKSDTDPGFEISSSSSSSVPGTTGGNNGSEELNPNPSAETEINSNYFQRERKALCNICNRRYVHLGVHKKYMHCSAEQKEALKQQCVGCKKKYRFLKRHMRFCHASETKNIRPKPKGKELMKRRLRGTDSKIDSSSSAKKTNQTHKTKEAKHSNNRKKQGTEQKEALKKQCVGCKKKFRWLTLHMLNCQTSRAKNTKRTGIDPKGTTTAAVAGTSGSNQNRKNYNKRTMCNICNLGFFNLAAHQKYKHCTAEEKEALKECCRICNKKFLCLESHIKHRHPSQANNANKSNKGRSKEKEVRIQQSSTSSKIRNLSVRKKMGNSSSVKNSNQELKAKAAKRHCSTNWTQKSKKHKTKVCSVCNQSVSASNFRRHYTNLHENMRKNSASHPEQRDSGLKKKHRANETWSKNRKKKCRICHLLFLNLALHNLHAHSVQMKRKHKQRMVKCTRCMKEMAYNNLWNHEKLYHASLEEREAFRERCRNTAKLRQAKIKHNQQEPTDTDAVI